MTATPSKFGEGFGGPGAPLRSPTLEVWDDVVDNLPPSLDLPAAQDKMGMSALRIFRRGVSGPGLFQCVSKRSRFFLSLFFLMGGLSF